MKLTLDRAALLKALDPASRVVERRNTIPILANLRLAAAGETLTVTATDLDIELRAPCPAQVETAGALTAPAARLHDIVRKLPDGAQIALEATSDSMMTLKSGRSRFQINTLPESDFSDITAGEMGWSFTIAASALAGMIGATQFAISTEETRYYLNGIYLHAGEGEDGPLLTAVATDGHRLARIHRLLPEGAAGMPGIIVPRKAVAEIGRLVDKLKGDIIIGLSATKIRVEAEGIIFTSKLIDGTFPDYQRVIPTGNDKLATLNAKLLAGAAERVATISGERGRAVKLSFADQQLTLSVTNPDAGEAREEIDADYDGPPIDIGFNARYLADVLGTLAGDSVLMKLADPGSPTILQTREGSELLTVLMPMRV